MVQLPAAEPVPRTPRPLRRGAAPGHDGDVIGVPAVSGLGMVGTTAEMLVLELTVKLVAGVVAKLTAVTAPGPTKLLPAMMMVVPPAVGPLAL